MGGIGAPETHGESPMNPPAALPNLSDGLHAAGSLSTGNAPFVNNDWIARHGTHGRNRE